MYTLNLDVKEIGFKHAFYNRNLCIQLSEKKWIEIIKIPNNYPEFNNNKTQTGQSDPELKKILTVLSFCQHWNYVKKNWHIWCQIKLF